jgi:hypothetical protein
MKINLTLVVDESDERSDRILDELELAAEGREGCSIKVGGVRFQADVVDVAEAPE